MSDKITPAMIKRFEKWGAGPRILIWLREKPRSFDDLINQYPDWYLWLVGKAEGKGLWVTAERIDRCAREDPFAALLYAAKYLPPETLDWCARKWPGIALHYARPYMPADLIAWCEKATGVKP